MNPARHPLWSSFVAWDKRRRCGVPDMSDAGDRGEFDAFAAGTEAVARLALNPLDSDHVKRNEFRLGVLGAQDIGQARATLRAVLPE